MRSTYVVAWNYYFRGMNRAVRARRRCAFHEALIFVEVPPSSAASLWSDIFCGGCPVVGCSESLSNW